MRIGGIVSTDQLDKQGEEVVQEGLDFRPFLREGWYNDNHGQRTSDVLGYPTDAFYVSQGSQLPNGRIAENNGWWAEGYLLNTTEARKVWEVCDAATASTIPGDRKLGFSIEGKVGRRDKTKPTRIMTALVRNVAITHCPVNTGTEVASLAKALMAGSSIENAGAAPGDGFPLRAESLDTGAAPEEEQEDEDAIKSDIDQDFPLEPLSEVDALAGWIPAMSAAYKRISPDDRMTKAEARIIVRSQRPGLSEREIDEIVNRARTGGL
jgi:hypothetical protein